MAGYDLCISKWIIILSLYFTINDVIFVEGRRDVENINVCREVSRFRCDDGQRINIKDVICDGGSRGACDVMTNQTIYQLCHGQQTCNSLGLQSMVCQDITVDVQYTCVYGQVSTACRSNICDKDSIGLRCSPGNVLHIQTVTCSRSRSCLHGSHVTLYTLCEGVEQCDASGLRNLLSEDCSNGRSLLVHYICIPAKVTENTCTSDITTLHKDFGLILTPPRRRSKKQLSSECKWALDPDIFDHIDVTVYLSIPRSTGSRCTDENSVLEIQYFECTGNEDIKISTELVCEVIARPKVIRSCGPVGVTSRLYRRISPDFVIAYQRSNTHALSSNAPGVTSCPVPPMRYTVTNSPGKPPVVIPGSNSSPVIPGYYTTTSGDLKDKNSNIGRISQQDGGKDGSSVMSKELKLILIYAGFGIVILALLIALIIVLVRYNKVSKRKGISESSEKLAPWRRDDTPLDTLSNGRMIIQGSRGNITQTMYPLRTTQETQNTQALIHKDEEDNTDHRMSTASGISTFLPVETDTDFGDLINTIQSGSFDPPTGPGQEDVQPAQRLSNNYYELPGNPPDIYEAVDQGEHPGSRQENVQTQNNFSHEMPPTMTSHVNPNVVPVDDFHYRINNDQYAIVKKKPQTLDKRINNVGSHAMDHIPQGHNDISEPVPRGESYVTDHVPQGHSNVPNHMPKGHSYVPDHVPQGHSYVPDHVLQGHSYVPDHVPQGHSYVPDHVPQGRSYVTDHVPQGHSYVTDHVPQGHSYVTEENSGKVTPEAYYEALRSCTQGGSLNGH